jgi:hypothetical protein
MIRHAASTVTETVTPLAQNKDTQKVDLSNRCQVPASARPRGIPPWTSAILNIIRGVNASQTRTGQDHGVSILMTIYGHAKIIGKS